ncbi:MAG: hypothetical protein KC646_07845 [Candidatus Cloacimonetes bacterium]|nr:hypothetical protein [Candidatus Cloacimonadota bacterium]
MYRLIILLFILAPSFQALESKLQSKLNFETLTPAHQYKDQLQDFHIKGLDLFDSVFLFNTTSSTAAVSYQDNLNGPISSKVLLNVESSYIKDQLITYYQKRLNISFSDDEKSKESYDFTWKEAPAYDDYNHIYSLSFLITKNDAPYWQFMKLVFLHKDGFISLEWDQPYTKQNLTLFSQIKKDMRIKQELSYQRQMASPIPKTQKTIKEAILPSYSVNLLSEVQNSEAGLIEKNKKVFGLAILVFSMIFFVFVLPKNK